MSLRPVALDDKYRLESGRIFLTGIQALVRLPMMQRRLDRKAGLDTAGYVTGYRGSPLGGIDLAFAQAADYLDRHQIRFQPGINEDLAATAIWGSQQTDLLGDNRHDGVFALWYGKGPGVDRSGDVLRHGNLAGSAQHGGVLLLAGDDHTCKSSTTAHQSEYAFMDAGIPVLYPASIQEILDYGLIGWAMSRYSGCWVAMKIVADTADSAAAVDVGDDRVKLRSPEDFAMPAGGLNIRLPASPFATAQALEQEMRLHRHKLYAALAFARANDLNRIEIAADKPRFGIVTCGKTYLDVLQALDDLGIDRDYAQRIGLSLLKIGMTWPLERNIVRRFAEGLEEILVVEEKRALIENQLKEQLYNWNEKVRPRVIGKFDESGEWILPSADELTPARIARVIAKRIARFHASAEIENRLAFLDAKEKALNAYRPPLRRVAYFCSGCPHNRSTKVPAGSRALAGIGCHFMSQWMDRDNLTFTHMGGEGATWIGQAPFSTTDHVFQNLGDGTYYHSGSLAIRAAVAAGVNITYKILYNDAVAMTGGQRMDGPLSVAMVARQLAAENVRRIAVISDDIEKYDEPFPANTGLYHRDELDRVQQELRAVKGVTALIYDQTCAAEKRRRRKRGEMTDPAKRVFINEAVCEGCGDCGRQSNCLSIAPLETAFGRKRRIDQSSCNKDYSCIEGFCPSFVTIHGGALRKPEAIAIDDAQRPLPEPALPPLDRPYNILVTGIGGTGIVTIGALLGMAAHLEGKGCTTLDMTGLAQKGGAVYSHVRIAAKPADIHAVRIAAGNADLLLGCDIVVAASFDALAKLDPARSRVIVNEALVSTGDFTRDPDWQFPGEDLKAAIAKAADPVSCEFLEATQLAEALLGDALAANTFLLGYAYQKGRIPLSAAALTRAIELNKAAVSQNLAAFRWGRQAALDLPGLRRAIAAKEARASLPRSLAEIRAHREAHLTAYQDRKLAARYRDLVDRVIAREGEIRPGGEALALAVAWNYAKLLAYKDEYEVARLYTDGRFLAAIRRQFTGDFRLHFHLAPPFLEGKGPADARPKKREFGPFMLTAMRFLAHGKFLRGTIFDPFGRSSERRTERRLIQDYEAMIARILEKLTPANYESACALATLPESIRGFGPVKEKAIQEVKAKEKALWDQFSASAAAKAPARQSALA